VSVSSYHDVNVGRALWSPNTLRTGQLYAQKCESENGAENEPSLLYRHLLLRWLQLRKGERRVLPERKPGISTLLCLMTKKDSEKEVERPHYYSQFWLDVAAGRRVIGAPKTDEGADGLESEMPEAVVVRNPVRDSIAAVTDGYQEPFAQNEAEPMFAEEEFAEPELEEELVGAVDDLDIPNIEVEETEIPQIEIAAQEEEEEEGGPTEEFFDEEEEEEEEDWTTSRGRKKAKPSRPTKQPPKRPEKRRRY